MAELSMFMVFESLRQEEKICTLTNPLAVVQPAVIPGNFSFVISFSLLVVLRQKDHILSASFISPSGEKIELLNDVKVHVAAGQEDLLTRDGNAVCMNLDVRNFLFKEEGFYVFSVVFDGQEYEHSFPVYKKDVNDT